MKLIKVENYELKVADEALLVRPIRRLWNMDRSAGKEQFYKQMSVLFYVYSPSSNYAYIVDEKERMKEVMAQEGITEIKNNTEFKAAVEAYKKLVKTSSSELLEDTRLIIEKMRQALKSIDFESLEEKDAVNAVKTVATVVGMIPKLVKDLTEAEKAVAKEMEEQTNARGSQELTVGDIWASQDI
jgi:ribonuclease HI